MTSLEKAIDLHNKFYNTSTHQNSVSVRLAIAKKSALIAVNEILEYTKEPIFPMGGATGYDYDSYLEEVKAEIERL